MTTSYKPQYLYKDVTYDTQWKVRREIEASENRRFGPEPVIENDHEAQLHARIDFWQRLNVVYSELEVITPEPDPAQELQAAKTTKLNQLENWFNEIRTSKDTYIISSLGFKANSNETAVINLSGLIGLAQDVQYAPEGKLTFMDFDNQPQQLDKDQLTKLKNEISAAGSASYAVKWQYRTTIEGAEDIDTIEKVEFVMPVFTFESGSLSPVTV